MMQNFQQLPELPEHIASDILANVFKESNVAPNTVPLEVLTSYSSYRKERFILQRVLLGIILLLFFLLPVLFIPPSFQVKPDIDPQNPHQSPSYQILVDNKLPVSHVVASIDGNKLPIYEIDRHAYSIKPTLNGRMSVTITLMNRQQKTQFIDITSVDNDSPVLLSTTYTPSEVTFTLEDNGSGINYDEIKAVDIQGNESRPLSFDVATGTVTLSYPLDTLNVFIPDYNKNTLHLVISIKND